MARPLRSSLLSALVLVLAIGGLLLSPGSADSLGTPPDDPEPYSVYSSTARSQSYPSDCPDGLECQELCLVQGDSISAPESSAASTRTASA